MLSFPASNVSVKKIDFPQHKRRHVFVLLAHLGLLAKKENRYEGGGLATISGKAGMGKVSRSRKRHEF